MYKKTVAGIEVNNEKQGKYHMMKKAHYHYVYEMYYLNAGNRRFLIDNQIHNIDKGTLLLLGKNVVHKAVYSSDKLGERTFVRFNDDIINRLYAVFGEEEVTACFNKSIFVIPRHRREYLESILKILEDEYKNTDKFSNLLMEQYIIEIFTFIIRYNKHMEDRAKGELSSRNEVIDKAVRYIADNYNKNITLVNVANYVGMSSTYFSKRFKEETAFGFKEYIINIRIAKSCSLLLESQLSITEIAYEIGFNDSNYFGDVFKRIKGISPLQFRRQAGNI